MRTFEFGPELSRAIAKYAKVEGENATVIPGVTIFKACSIASPLPSVYEPCLCIIAQGSKEVKLGNEIFRYVPLQYLAVGVDLPITNRILKASKAQPYLLMKITINRTQIAEILAQSRIKSTPEIKSEKGLFVGDLSEPMRDGVLRLARLLSSPDDANFLAEQTQREIFYRVIKTEDGLLFSQAALKGSNTQNIIKGIQKIRNSFTKPLRVHQLAEMVGMSVSSFHSHFKSVTFMSPLQFQKKLRLIEARKMIFSMGSDAAGAAHAVGYESVSQFSREYARMYGNPPGRDKSIAKNRKRGI